MFFTRENVPYRKKLFIKRITSLGERGRACRKYFLELRSSIERSPQEVLTIVRMFVTKGGSSLQRNASKEGGLKGFYRETALTRSSREKMPLEDNVQREGQKKGFCRKMTVRKYVEEGGISENLLQREDPIQKKALIWSFLIGMRYSIIERILERKDLQKVF